MFKVNNKSTRTRCEICSKLTMKIAERRQWRRVPAAFCGERRIRSTVKKSQNKKMIVGS